MPDSTPSPEDPNPLNHKYQRILRRSEISWQADRTLERCLGAGGQGRVYLSRRLGAEHFSLPIALKVFSPDGFPSSEAYHEETSRIARVAAQVARVQHDNVVDVLDFLEIDGIIVMEMEFVDGYDLRCLLSPAVMQSVKEHASNKHWEKLNQKVVTEGETQPRLKPAMAVAILRECLHGLSSLHAMQVVHNDLKPSNIMLKRSGNVKLIDTGSAFAISDTPKKVACTPEFAAPEILAGTKATIQSDLASLGYVLLEMLCGQRTFQGMSIKAMLDTKRDIFRLLPTLLPREEFAYFDMLLPFLRKMVAPDPDDRFASAEEADQSTEGAASIEEELVKGNLSQIYQIEIRDWIREVVSDGVDIDAISSTRTLD
jgi:serine/threonine-protein kinase